MIKTLASVFFLFYIGVYNPLFSDSGVLRMATTTSTDNTGLLDYLAPFFKADTGIELQWVAVGTGKALVLGKNCDVDVLMVHAPDMEKKFIDNGYGIRRYPFMYNDFVIVGPAYNTAHITGKPIAEALRSIAADKEYFASRGDNSGTHSKEMKLWRESGLRVPERESWYIQTGQGMLGTLRIAAERRAYTLTDRGTFIKFTAGWEGVSPLTLLVEGDKELVNQYSVIAVNPKRCSNADFDLTDTFIQWIISSSGGQRLIADFKLLGQQIFFPNAAMFQAQVSAEY